MRKNIMLFCGSLSNGGAERSIVRLANTLSIDNNVYVVVVNAKKCDYHPKVLVFEIKEFSKKITLFVGVKKLKKLKKKYNIHTTISCMTAFNFYNAISRYKDKIVITITNHMTSKNEGVILDLFKRLTAKISDTIVCCSESVRLDQIKKYHANPNKTKVIYNYCNPKEIDMALSDIPIDKSQEMYFVTMARLTYHKGVQHIIRSMAKIIALYPNIKLLVLGRGPYKETLLDIVKELKIQKNIIFMDFIPNPYIFLKNSRCFILASSYEGLPNSIIEAMCCGTPIIATDVPGGNKEMLTKSEIYDDNPIEDILEADYGILVPGFFNKNDTHSEDLLADAMISLLDDKKYKYYSKKSLERSKKYSQDAVIKDWQNII